MDADKDPERKWAVDIRPDRAGFFSFFFSICVHLR
jgi:hypothetical protein